MSSQPRARDGEPERARDRAEEALPFAAILKSVIDGIAYAGKAGVSVPEAVGFGVRAAVRRALDVGGNLVVGTKAIVMGVIRGTGEREAAALLTLSNAARAVIGQTADLNGDLGAAARGLVLGAVASAEHMGVTPSKAAVAAHGAAIDEAERLGPDAAVEVRGALKSAFGGVHVDVP